MPRVIQHNVVTQTVQGEVTINLNLTITINDNGTVSVEANPKVKSTEPEIPDTIFAIPDFESAEVLGNFGKDV